jgi:hypothetical protein
MRAQVTFDQFEPRIALAQGLHQLQCQLVRMGNLAIGAGIDQQNIIHGDSLPAGSA